MKKIFDLIISFRISLVKILFYELFYIISGFKGNNFNIRGDKKFSDNIPCSYYFLSKIYKQIKDIDFKSFVDLGCGHGRVLFFFSKKINSNYLGVELFENSYQSSLKTLKGIQNVKVVNINFFDMNFNENRFDCYFLNDPLKELSDHNKLINSILSAHKLSRSPAIFIVVNLDQKKNEIFKSLNLVYNYHVNSRYIKIYKYKNNK